MRTKRILAMFMTLLMVITMLPSLVFASAPSGELGGKLGLKGTAEVGKTLSANYKKVTPEGMSDDYVSFQWSRKTGEELTEVGTEKTYTVAEEDLGSVIVLKITGLEDQGVTGSLTAESKTVAAAGEGVEEEDPEESEDTSSSEETAPEETTEPGEAEVGTTDEVQEIPGEETQEEAVQEVPAEEEQVIDVPETSEEEIVIGNEESLVIPEENGESSNTGQEEPVSYSAEAEPEDGSDTVDFGTVEEGTEDATSAKYVVVRNTGTGDLNFNEISPEHFMVQDIDDTLAPGEEVTLWIQPREGLEPGSYEDTITYESEEGTSASFLASVNVEAAAAAAPEITADTQSLTFSDLTDGYAQVTEGQKVQISNSGTADVTLVIPQSQYFDITAGNASDLTVAAGSSLEFTVMPKVGLSVGEYSEELVFAVQNEDAAQVKVTASVKVTEAEEPAQPSVSADVTGLTFQEVTEGYESAPAAQTVTLTNNGSETVTLAQPTAENFEVGALSVTELAAGGTATFTVQPKTGLTAGTYEDTIYITDNSNNRLTSVTAAIQVAEQELTYSLTVEPDTLDFGSREAGYTEAPEAQTVTVTNNGTGTLNLTQPESDFFNIGNLSDIELAPGESATFTVQPKRGLEESEYLEVIQIPNEEGAAGMVNAYFNVTAEPRNILRSIQNPAEITGLANGTEKSVQGLKLPATVVIVTSEGNLNASVTWDVRGCAYDPSSREAQNFAVRGRVTLPDGVENPNDVSLITSVRVGVEGSSLKIASADDNAITGISSNGQYTTESKITFTAVGAGMDNNDPGEGDTRYIPLNWTIANTNSWQAAPYSATFRMSRAGTYTLSVVFNEQEYDGSNWVNTGAQDTKSVTFTVANAAAQTITPTPTGAAQGRNAVQTGDNTNIIPFVILLVVAVACVAGVVIYRKKR